MQRLLPLIIATSVALLYLLTLSTGNNSRLTNYFWWFIAAASVLILILLAAVIRYIWFLAIAHRRKVLGSQIARRLAMMFTIVTVLPGLFVFGVSAQFISNSINSWFGDDTDQALEHSLSLSKSALNLAVDNSFGRAVNIQVDLFRSVSRGRDLETTLQNAPLANQFEQLALYDLTDNRIRAERNPKKLPQSIPSKDILAQLVKSGSSRTVENINETLYAQGWLILPEYNGHQYALFFRQPIPNKVAQDATLIENARAKYAELNYAKEGLRHFFLITLLIATLIAIMLALAMALFFSYRFIEPILSLAEGARAIAQGDFSQKRPVFRNDELGRLTHLFNHMTEQLSLAQESAERNRQQTEAARYYLETVLESLTAGVITVDRNGILRTFNQSAEKILGIPLSNLLGSDWHTWPNQSPQQAMLAEVFETILTTIETDKPVQIPYTAPDDARILLGKATTLLEDGLVFVFDDVTVLVRAQKEAAWGEVAKRLAHEIRNPLTPIQLSAERMAWKLQDKLGEKDALILTRSTDTIIKQVEALKEMVEAFRNYARSPSMKFETVNLNEICGDVLLLYEGSPCTFASNLSNIPLYIKADHGAMRQVLHNLLKNAAEAAAESEKPTVNLSTWQEGKSAVLMVCNNGKSFSNEMLHNAFEPYITDKPTGTGLGLPVVKKIIEEHSGRISISNQTAGGACVKIALPELVENINEK
ncbi:MAG: PAS domain-containing sensor histidine kinase [Neisseria sp.]|uniref:sensor histidine kinase n=1 Tax=Neisseria sp. TaxID=192066 RepID=UPI0026DD947B|nr:PAS domain-containing sensor histidine kinase [Neisseria sp.]MDO4641395.1 PAS domain-containing sensor histidine kinase [Neisseria sp.]